jgi:hypothetical protein
MQPGRHHLAALIDSVRPVVRSFGAVLQFVGKGEVDQTRIVVVLDSPVGEGRAEPMDVSLPVSFNRSFRIVSWRIGLSLRRLLLASATGLVVAAGGAKAVPPA